MTTKKSTTPVVPAAVTDYLAGRACDARHLDEAIDAQAAQPADAPLVEAARAYLSWGVLRHDDTAGQS